MDKISSQKLKTAMLENCIGTLELAQAANIQPATISKFLKNDSQARLPTVLKICKALGVQPSKILKESDSDETQNKNLSA